MSMECANNCMHSLLISYCFLFSREILMDITDYDGDSKAGIQTIPVKYGKNVAAFVALACSCVSSISACTASLLPCIMRLVEGEQSLQSLIGMPSLASLPALLSNHEVRKVMLAVAGSGMFLQRAFSVWKTNGDDANLADRAVRDSIISVVLALASFV